jgi:uncharacterized membrane protein
MQKDRIFQMLLLASGCCVLLVLARIGYRYYTMPDVASWQAFVGARGATYIFLIWNLILAWAPFVAARRFDQLQTQRAGAWVLAGVFGLWLLFLPNAPYIVTDFLHLKHKPPVPLWFDLVLLFSFAGTGLLLGLLSLHNMQQALTARLSARWAQWLIGGAIALSGFGIWLGRFQRWNSWDIFTRPDALLADLLSTLSSWPELARAIGVSVLLSGIFWMGYGLLTALLDKNQPSKVS